MSNDTQVQAQLNDWFLSLPEGRQKVLIEEKWMLAGAAFLAGQSLAVEAALRDAPQAEPEFVNLPTVEELTAMLSARPSAPTAKPLFGELIAQHHGLREEIAAESERADFEAAYRARYPVSCDLDPAKFNRSDVGDYEDIRVSIAWAMWQARASKGTK